MGMRLDAKLRLDARPFNHTGKAAPATNRCRNVASGGGETLLSATGNCNFELTLKAMALSEPFSIGPEQGEVHRNVELLIVRQDL
jgi:hypothetical protein